MPVESLARHTESPSRDDLVAAAAKLVPLLAANAEKAERDRRLPDENVEALRKAGLLRLWQPRRLGGHEVDIRTYVEIVMELCRAGCGSSAWYVFILNGCAWLVGAMKDAAQRDVWQADTAALVCSQLQPVGIPKPAEGGVMLSGSWNFGSGSHHAQWSLVGFPILDASGAPVDVAEALVPISELRIEDTWFVCGMAATASDTLHARDVYVPEHRIFRISSLASGNHPTEHTSEALYHTAFGPTGALMLTPVVVGLASAAFESALEQLARKPKPIAYTFVADTRQAPTTQIALAQASALIDSARLQVRAAADAVDEASRAGHAMDRTQRSFQRMRCAHAVRSSRQAMDLILDVLGASGFALSNPVQRMWRDMNVASRHGFIHPENGIGVYSRAIAGVEETISPLA
jgi:alkylation response protein AidB-like acyl-CoA dehydrogenase